MYVCMYVSIYLFMYNPHITTMYVCMYLCMYHPLTMQCDPSHSIPSQDNGGARHRIHRQFQESKLTEKLDMLSDLI